MKNKEFRNIIIAGSAFTVLAVICGSVFLGIKTGALVLLTGLVLMAVFIFYTRKRYKKIVDLNDYLVRVLAENDNDEILDQEEGELSILKTNIYKTTSTLKFQKELLSDDKKNLAAAIADISHQLKTPLTSMMVMNDLLVDEQDENKRTEFLQTQSSQLNRMNWLIQTLLKLSKLDAGTIVLKKEDVSSEELIDEAVKPFGIQFDLRNIKFKSDISDLIIRCDKNWTVEAIQNIIKNCIEHMDDGGELSVTMVDTNIFTQLTVRDTGCGIAAEDIPHIFERFYKGKNAGKDSVGIGLALSKSIIEGEQGEINVESTEGVGTKFIIKFYKTLI
ncbi:MAG: HAMP domain-containing histidine kinase [Lachnospiraceae bacterium]|nr:HAMP domain-containing histidine kinase [Lachnospiraceae bacterium]